LARQPAAGGPVASALVDTEPGAFAGGLVVVVVVVLGLWVVVVVAGGVVVDVVVGSLATDGSATVAELTGVTTEEGGIVVVGVVACVVYGCAVVPINAGCCKEESEWAAPAGGATTVLCRAPAAPWCVGDVPLAGA
jgi:hypothetical protein